MQMVLKKLQRQARLLALVKRLLIVAVLGVGLVAARGAYADGGRYVCAVSNSSGGYDFVSCGSSAGNFVEGCNTAQCDAYANAFCARGDECGLQ